MKAWLLRKDEQGFHAAIQSVDAATTVMPFILRGVNLACVDSVMAPIALRQAAGTRLAQDLD